MNTSTSEQMLRPVGSPAARATHRRRAGRTGRTAAGRPGSGGTAAARAASKATGRAGGAAAVACSVLAVTALSAAASAAGPAATRSSMPGVAAPARVVWTRINWGDSSATQIGASLGLARTADGVLHVIWNRGSGESNGTTKIFETFVSPTGAILGNTTVATGWNALAGGNALVVMADGSLRLFVAGQATPKSPGGMNILSAPASGRGFLADGSHVWGGEFAQASPYIAATVSHGQLVTAWAGSYHVGLDATANGQYPQVYHFMSVPQLATDAKTGAVVFSGITNDGKGGVYVEQVLPQLGPATLLGTGGNTDPGVSGATARIGAAGVYVLTADGNAKVLTLHRYGGASIVVARGASYYFCNVFAAPGGRLWVVWYPGSGSDLYATRSNGAVTRFEPVQTLPLPGSVQLADSPLYGNGAGGPLDLFARLYDSSGQGFEHTHVLGIMGFTSAVVPIKSATGKVLGQQLKIFVTDAGDPVAGATVTVGTRHATTRTLGVANFNYPGSPSGAVTVTVTAPGYHPVTGSAAR